MAFEFKPRKKPETISKSVRFPKDLVDKIEKEAFKNDAYFSDFVIQACENAIKEVELEYNKKKKKGAVTKLNNN